MFTHMMLPWWGWAYLLFVLTMFVAGFFSEKKPDMNVIGGSALSLFSICVFVIGFFNPQLVQFLGYFIIPMTAVGIFWEFTRAIEETGLAQEELLNERELDDGERVLLLNLAIGLNALVVVPGYVMGIVLCFNVLGAI